MNKNLKLMMIAILLTSILSAGFIYNQLILQNKVVNNTQPKEQQKVIDDTITAVGKIYELPQGETPTIAEVADTEKLKDQQFFKFAKNGDKVLIYVNSGKAILYRPSSNKIVDVGPVAVDAKVAGAATQSASVTNPVDNEAIKPENTKITVALYNGTDIEGLTYQIEDPIITNFEDISVETRQSASRNDYLKTVIVDVSKKYTTKATEMAKFLNAQLTVLPPGEIPPKEDILVIIGKDKSEQ